MLYIIIHKCIQTSTKKLLGEFENCSTGGSNVHTLLFSLMLIFVKQEVITKLEKIMDSAIKALNLDDDMIE